MTAVLVLRWLEIHPSPSWLDAATEPVIWVDPVRFDAEWRRSDQWVGPHGVPGGYGDRYPRAGEWILGRNEIDMLQIWIDEERVGFTDGRHRFAWLRDHAVSAIPMQIPSESLAEGIALFGSELRTSVLAPPIA